MESIDFTRDEALELVACQLPRPELAKPMLACVRWRLGLYVLGSGS